jgi:hypothetical protein
MSRSFLDRAWVFTKRLFGPQKTPVSIRRTATTRLRLEALEDRNLLSVLASEANSSLPLPVEGVGMAMDAGALLSSYAATVQTVEQTIEAWEQQALLAIYRLESTLQTMLQQLLNQGVVSTSTDSPAVQSSSTAPQPSLSQQTTGPTSSTQIFATPDVLLASADGLSPASGSGLPGGFSPQQIQQAYGFNQITFSNGTIKGDGSGQTIAIVDAYSQPNIASNLQTFDSMYGLPAPPSFSVVNESGGSSLPAADTGWGMEESLDVEWAHAMAPGANIVLVEANSSSMPDMTTAVNYARSLPNVSVVSMSWGSNGGEFSTETSYDSIFTTPAGHNGVTFVASSGDTGSSAAPIYPSVSPTVLAVGGTQLTLNSAGNYQSETAWSDSGGGISSYETQPSYQKGVVTQSSTMRTVPDVAYNASSASPYAVYDTSGYGGWIEVYGTSAGAPQWAALIAIANQGRALDGEGTLDGATQTLPMIYQMPSSDFHAVTSGSNGAYSAGPGYNLVTGRGTPVANLIVNSLVGSSGGGSSSPSSWQSVNLSSYYNRLGIATKAFSGGGLDGNGHALSVSANIPWQGTLIPLGPPNTNDVVSAQGQTITLPSGVYSSLTILAEAVNGNQLNEPFTVTYTNGFTQTFTQSLTDWQSFPSYSYEQRAVAMADETNADGTQSAGPYYMSAFVLPLHYPLAVKSITLPNDSNVEILGMSLYYDATPSQPVSLSSYYNRLGIATKAFSGGGLDGNGHALSVSANISWQGSLIPLGPPNTNDVVSAQGQTITLPSGVYSSLTILAEAVNGNQLNEPFTVTYTNGFTQTFTQSLTDWQSFPSYSYEQRAVAMADETNANGTQSAGPYYMSAFVLPLHYPLAVKSITLPNDSNVEVMAMSLS